MVLVPVLAFLACVGKDPEPTGNGAAADGGGSGNGDGQVGSGDGASSTDGGGGGPTDGAPSTGDGGIPITAGDIVVLEGSGIVGAAGTQITEWKSAVGGLVALPTATAAPIVTDYAKKPSEKCVVFSGQRPLAIAASTAIDISSADDFSVTVAAIRGPSHATATPPEPDFGQVVVARNTLVNPGYDYQGFALLSDWQTLTKIEREPRWAARLAYTTAGEGSGFEVKGDFRAVNSKRDVVAMYRRGNDLYLRDGDVLRGPHAGASAHTAASATRPLTIGQADDDQDPATRFNGTLCAVIIHRGAETDGEIIARMDALKAKYPE